MRTVLVPGRGLALTVALGIALGSVAAACGGGSTGARGPHVVVTTSILGDVVTNLVGGGVTVDVVMPPGADPHDFAPSARQAAEMRAADVLVVNGAGFEVGLRDTIDAAERDGVTVVRATDGLDLRPGDPHFFTDPRLMRSAAEHIDAALAAKVPGLDSPAQRARADRYLVQLTALDAEIAGIVDGVPLDRRILVTNHEVFGYFADRYGFRVLGSIIPRGTTLAEPSAAALHQLAIEIARTGVPAIFAETSSPRRLAEALAAEGTGVQVVSLYSESLGLPGSAGGTYLSMMRTDAERIAAALG